ncbi:MAG: hypothetical protein KIT83_13850 [Bryobacterales bacterium]|nr:hypothetical protein [Bryobacterales bacterium]
MQQSRMEPVHPEAIALFRHAIATLAYRFAVAVRDSPNGFADYTPCPGGRSPGQILAHLNVLIEWSTNVVEGSSDRPKEALLVWDQAVRRFVALLNAFDATVATAARPFPAEKLLQGPLADALTHVGQLTMLRRMASSPVHAESYFRAEIQAGQIRLDV